jgi:hypothetical protein
MMTMELDSHTELFPKEKPYMKKLMTLALALSFLSTVAVSTAFGQDEPKKEKKKKGKKGTTLTNHQQAIS